MLGGNDAEQQKGNKGIYLLAAEDIFSKLEEREYSNLTLMVSFFEIYGGKIFDLLNDRKKLRHLEVCPFLLNRMQRKMFKLLDCKTI